MFFILAGLGASSQPYLGIFGGVSNGKLMGDSPDKAKYKSLIGFNFGANFDVKVSKSMYLSFQPSYSQEGTRVFYTLPRVKKPVDSLKLRLNYVSLPVLLKVTSTNQRFYALGGIEGAILVSDSFQRGGKEETLKEDLLDWNLVIHFGAGMRIPLGFPRLFVELRYTQGLANLTDQPEGDSFIPRVKTTGFKIIVGLEIPLSNKEK
jgi:hypothetical protein